MSDLTEGRSGPEIVVRVFAILGAIGVVAGVAIWVSGNSSYNTCKSVNSFLNGAVPASPCSQGQAHAGVLVLLVGVAVLILAAVIRFADKG